MDRAIADCVADGCGVVLVLCTGRVQHTPAVVPVLHADELAHREMARLLGAGNLGVICPVPEQLPDIERRWSERLDREITATDADPYSGNAEKIDGAGKELACAGVDYIFLGCIGYTAHHATLAAASGVETRTARGLAVRGAVDWLNAMP